MEKIRRVGNYNENRPPRGFAQNMTSLGRQVFAVFLDSTIQNLLYQLFAKSLQGSLAISIDSWKDDVKLMIEFAYSILSLEITFFEDIIKTYFPLLSPSTKEGLNGSPAMSLLGLSWGQKGSTVVFVLLFLLRSAALKLHAMALSSGWRSDVSSLKRSIAEALRIAIVAAKSLSIISFLTFLVRADDAPTLLLRISGFRMSAASSSPTAPVPYRASQLYLEQRKFMWLAMIGLASAVMVTVDWDYIGEVTRRQYRHFSQTISFGIELARNCLLPSRERTRIDSSHTRDDSRRDGTDTTSEEHMSCTRCLKSPPENAHRNNSCGHVFCYLCIAPYVSEDNILVDGDNDADPGEINSCPLCGKRIDSAICWQKTES